MKMKPLCMLACVLGLAAPAGFAADVDPKPAAADEAAVAATVPLTVVTAKGGG